jgi:hypothetical protein
VFDALKDRFRGAVPAQKLLYLRQVVEAERNPLLVPPRKMYSQSDEDGIIARILSRLDLSDPEKTFVEIGVGDGRENNTVALGSRGWRGVWLGAEDLRFRPSPSRLAFSETWITRDTAVAKVLEGLRSIGGSREAVSLMSVDIDGNDYHVAEELLKAQFRPALYIVEYNARFIPGHRFVMDYNPDPQRAWTQGNIYFGSSITSWEDLFGAHGYTIVACNITGVNAFLVRSDLLPRFEDVTWGADANYQPMLGVRFPDPAHRVSVRTLESSWR